MRPSTGNIWNEDFLSDQRGDFILEKDFFDVFPSLKVKKELEELLDMVFVTRVSCNPSRTHMGVYKK